MARGRFAFADWNLSLDLTATAPRPHYRMTCATCHESGPSGTNRDALEAWALGHTGHNPDHRAYTGTTAAAFVVTPTGSNPLRGKEVSR